MSITSQGWKLVSSAGLVAVSYFSTWYIERKNALKQSALRQLDEQIQTMYGPLYGHSLVLKSSYASVIGPRSGMKEYLSDAETKKDDEAIRRWRSFVWNNIRPLEREIHDLFIKNAHLVARDRGKFPDEFNEFLNHSARFEFIMERWKNEAGMLEITTQFTGDDYLEEHNSPGEPNYNELFDHVSVKYEHLQNKRDEIMMSLSSGVESSGIKGILSILK